MKLCITRDRVGDFTQTLFNRGFDVSTYQDFAVVRQEGCHSVFVDIVDKAPIDDIINATIAEVLLSVKDKNKE